MHENAAVWIDHSQAVIVFTDAGKISTETIESSLEPHTRYAGRADEYGGGTVDGGDHLVSLQESPDPGARRGEAGTA